MSNPTNPIDSNKFYDSKGILVREYLVGQVLVNPNTFGNDQTYSDKKRETVAKNIVALVDAIISEMEK